MTIQAGDIKLRKALVMSDDPEGGQGPSSDVIADGVSNEIFLDISESDRAVGRVSMRQIHAMVQSEDQDTFLGANLIVAEPPDDPNVSITLMSTGGVFDRRSEAVARLEAYLTEGARYAGYLFGNHIEGMQTVQILQRTTELPPIGATLVLRKREGFSDEFTQFVRVTEATVTQRTFTDMQGDFTRYELGLKISDPLRADFPGFDGVRVDPSKAEMAIATKVAETIVANASRYYGVVDLEDPASIGDFTVKGDGIYTQLVPSAQIETALADVRTNQVSENAINNGGPITILVPTYLRGQFTPTKSYIGGPVTPGSLSISGSWFGGTYDKGGILYTGSAQIGTIDYENGVMTFNSANTDNAAVDLFVTYKPASVPSVVQQSQGINVTAENRSQSWIRTLSPIPAPGTTSVSFAVAGRWYVLRDDGSGALRGVQSSYGAGTVNFTTGTLSVTLGELPDVGTAIIVQWSPSEATLDTTEIALENDGKFFWPINTSGEVSVEAGSKAIEPGELSISWFAQGADRTATDNGAGQLVGNASGTVDYARGVIRFSPEILPAKGSVITVTTTSREADEETVSVVGGVGNLGATNITPGSLSFGVVAQRKAIYLGSGGDGTPVNVGSGDTYLVRDNGAGGLVMKVAEFAVPCGTVNYAAGTFELSDSVALNGAQSLAVLKWDNLFVRSTETGWSLVAQ